MECLYHRKPLICLVCRNHNLVFISLVVIFLTDNNGQHFWIGANDEDIEGDWVWESDKSKLVFSDWHVHQPDNYMNSNCGQIRWHNTPYKWNDASCYFLDLYICEK